MGKLENLLNRLTDITNGFNNVTKPINYGGKEVFLIKTAVKLTNYKLIKLLVELKLEFDDMIHDCFISCAALDITPISVKSLIEPDTSGMWYDELISHMDTIYKKQDYDKISKQNLYDFFAIGEDIGLRYFNFTEENTGK